MAIGIDMFGAGGEGLGGLFLGNQMAQQREQAALEQQQTLSQIAAQQAMTRQRDLTNQLDEALLPSKIEEAQMGLASKKEAAGMEKFNRQGEQFGRLGQTLGTLPAAARPAALKQMAAQAGIGDDNPMLQTLMGMDPEQMPDAMLTFSKGFYEQGDKARAEAQKRGLMMEQKRAELEAKAAEGEANRQMRRDIAAEASADRRFLGQLAASSRQQATAARGGKPVKETTDQAVARMIREKVESGEWSADEGMEAAQRHIYNKATLGKSGVEESVMGTKTPEERVESAITKGRKGGAATPQQGAAGADTGSKKPEVGTVQKGYRYKGGDPSKQSSWEKV